MAGTSQCGNHLIARLSKIDMEIRLDTLIRPALLLFVLGIKTQKKKLNLNEFLIK